MSQDKKQQKQNKYVDLEVLPIKDAPDSVMPTSKPISDNLPTPPFVMTIVAAVKSGKSTIIGNLLLRFYPNCFDSIFYFSPTADMDKSTRSFLKVLEDDDRQELTIFSQHSDLMNIDSYIDLLCDEQRNTPQEKRKRVLIVLDDIVGYKMNKLNFLCSRYRHYNFTIIVSTQVYRRLNPIMRINSTCIIICKVSNNKEFMKLEEEILENVPNYLEHYETATYKRFDFLFFNIQEQRLFHNFTTLLWEK